MSTALNILGLHARYDRADILQEISLDIPGGHGKSPIGPAYAGAPGPDGCGANAICFN